MNNKIVKLLLRKELLDVFRDRKAVLMLVLVPLILYPLIFFAAFAVISVIQTKMVNGEYTVIVDTDDDGALLEQISAYNKEQISQKESQNSDKDSDENKTESGFEQIEALTFEEFLQKNIYDIADCACCSISSSWCATQYLSHPDDSGAFSASASKPG